MISIFRKFFPLSLARLIRRLEVNTVRQKSAQRISKYLETRTIRKNHLDIAINARNIVNHQRAKALG